MVSSPAGFKAELEWKVLSVTVLAKKMVTPVSDGRSADWPKLGEG
jgi:hypothetical protein